MTAAEDAAVLEGRLGAIGRELGVKPSSCSPAVAGEAPATPTVAAADSTPPPPTAAAAAPRIGMTDSPLPQWARLTISGGLAGLVTKTATAPLDRIKVLLQVQAMSGVDGKYSGIIGSANKIFVEEGTAAFWRGNAANCARIVPVYACRFAFNDVIRGALAEPGQDIKKLRPDQTMIAGTCAGVLQQIFCYPFETVRTRLSLGGSATGLGQNYNGIIDCFSKTIKVEGAQALYKGLAPSVMYGGPYVGLNMSLNELSKQYLTGGDVGSAGVATKLVSGAFGATTAQCIVFPFDTLRRRMQANGENGAARIYANSIDCVKKTIMKEGVAGFYKGVGANAARMIPTGAIQHLAYSVFKQLLGCDNS